MKIARIDADLLRLPMPRPMLSGSSSGAGGKPVDHINMPLVRITTDDGITGIGYAWSLMGGGLATRSILVEDFAPHLLGENPLDHERLWQKLYRKLQSVGRAGVVIQAQAAVDLALWDIKGKVAGLPVYKLMGGMRERAPVYGSDGGWLYMTVDEMLAEFRAYLDKGMMGIKMKVGHADPGVDIERVQAVRDGLGPDAWIAVDANQQWNVEQAMKAGRAFEKANIAWLEEPLICEDIPGHARLARDLDIAIAMGETLGSRHEFNRYLQQDAADVLQPDIIRVGGITETVKVVTLAEVNGKAVAPHHMMETTIQIACGVMREGPIEYMPWLSAAFPDGAAIEGGYMYPSKRPGLGLEIADEAIERYRVE
jgi:L-alanine-DL-glutamate epimerase-like enolase superfamily enzyme